MPELQPYRTLRRPLEHIRQGFFVAEGDKVVRRLLASDLKVVSILLTPEWYEQLFSGDSPETAGLIARVENAQLFVARSEEHTSELQSRLHLVCRLLLEK